LRGREEREREIEMVLRGGEEGPVGPKGSSCPCIPQRVAARLSSSESLEGARASVKKGPAGCWQRLWYNALHRLRGGGPPKTGGLGTYSGVLIPTSENMWGRWPASQPIPLR
jgi:hypothetical protein